MSQIVEMDNEKVSGDTSRLYCSSLSNAVASTSKKDFTCFWFAASKALASKA